MAATVALALGLTASRAAAGGLEYTGAGARGLARGGAVAAKAEDPMVLLYNPAGLTELRGSQFLFDLNLALFHACVDPIGYYGWGAYRGGSTSRLPDASSGDSQLLNLGTVAAIGPEERAYYRDELDTVCLDHRPLPLPQIAWTRRVTEWFGVGFGLLFPPVQPTGRYGDDNGVIRQADGDLRPSPVRYMQLSSSNLALFPTLGLALRPSDALRLGVSLQWGMIGVSNRTMAATGGGTSPEHDLIAHVRGDDLFVPGLVASLHLVPLDALDLVASLRWQDAIDASGELEFESGVFNPQLQPHRSTVQVEGIEQQLPWQATLALRYAQRLVPRPSGDGADEAAEYNRLRVHDPMQDEAWDVELDLQFQANAENHNQLLRPVPNQEIEFRCNTADPSCGGALSDQIRTVEFPEPEMPVTAVEKRWKDQVSVRLGASYNPLPGLLSIHTGAHYEDRGVDPAYMQVDFWPLRRLGLHAGVTVRLSGMTDLTLSYGHIFQETLVVAPPPHAARQTGGFDKTVGTPQGREMPLDCDDSEADPDYCVARESGVGAADGEAALRQNLTKSAGGDPAWIVNSGTYRSSYDILAVGLNVHF